MKIFGFWAAELAQRWQDDFLPEVKSMAQLVMSHVQELTGSFYVEVQERVSRLFHVPLTYPSNHNLGR